MNSNSLNGHRLRICLVSSEAVPYSKTGGLADVAGALSRELAQIGHEVILVVPNHRNPNQPQDETDFDDAGLRVSVDIHGRRITARVLETNLTDSNCRVYLIDQPMYFERSGLYQTHGQDFPDNCERFSFFCRATLELLEAIEFEPHVVHCNDWQTGLLPALVALDRHDYSMLRQAATVYTIHNLAFQGVFWKWDMPLTGLGWQHFNWEQMESHDQLNLMKTGIVFATRVTTVSPTYAREIQTPDFGCGLDELLAHRQDNLTGILNGIDGDEWNPATDPLLPENYDADSYRTGKSTCREELLSRLKLPNEKSTPVIGMVSRLTDQKGLDLLIDIADQLAAMNAQFVFLGTGDSRYEAALQKLNRMADNVSATIGFNNKLAHLIEAGSDIFLMPSRYEPCGLNQMYSLAYGTLPIVRRTGGLADSVIDANTQNIANNTANGFVFDDYTPNALLSTIERAVDTFSDRALWHKLLQNGMHRDWSWKNSAEQYQSVYWAARDEALATLGISAR